MTMYTNQLDYKSEGIHYNLVCTQNLSAFKENNMVNFKINNKLETF